VAPGEFVLVHVGLAIARIDRAEARRAWRVLEELGQTAEVAPGDEPREGDGA
jgi:hydrogenase maturation factor